MEELLAEIEKRDLIEDYIHALLGILELGGGVSVFMSAIEVNWYQDSELTGAVALYRISNATPEQKREAAEIALR